MGFLEAGAENKIHVLGPLVIIVTRGGGFSPRLAVLLNQSLYRLFDVHSRHYERGILLPVYTVAGSFGFKRRQYWKPSLISFLEKVFVWRFFSEPFAPRYQV